MASNKLAAKHGLDVIYEDNHLLVINKKAGDLVHPSSTTKDSLDVAAKNYLKEKLNKPGKVYLGVVHRIDRPTSGVLVFTRTSKAAARLSKLFQDKEVTKTYWAIVEQKPPTNSGTLHHYIKKNEDKKISMVSDVPKKDYKDAVLHYNTIGHSNKSFLLEVNLETGRYHQIRAQFAHMEFPVQGDLRYGFPKSNADASISLHARSIEFMHPVRKEIIKIEAPLPKNPIWKNMEAIIK